MDAFEEIVVGLLKYRKPHYWTWQSYKVNITKDEKKLIGKPSMPRPEIDILAYRPQNNELLWVECKSYLDSFGVAMLPSGKVGDSSTKREFELFANDNYRKIVSDRLLEQVITDGLCSTTPTLRYCLVAGHIYNDNSRQQIREQFQHEGWLFYDEIWIRDGLAEIAKMGYENDVAVIVAKLFGKTKVI